MPGLEIAFKTIICEITRSFGKYLVCEASRGIWLGKSGAFWDGIRIKARICRDSKCRRSQSGGNGLTFGEQS